MWFKQLNVPAPLLEANKILYPSPAGFATTGLTQRDLEDYGRELLDGTDLTSQDIFPILSVSLTHRR